jgi:hypothetical protein
MEPTVGSGLADRRRSVRHYRLEDHGIVTTRVRPGHRAVLINISASGALIETAHRLLPGASVDLHVERNNYRASVRGRVLRCSVVRVRAASISYCGAIGFDRCLPWFVEPDGVDPTQTIL